MRVSDDALGIAVAGPEEIFRVRPFELLQRVDDDWRQRTIHRRARFRLVEKQLRSDQPLAPTRDGVADAEPGVAQQQRERLHALPVPVVVNGHDRVAIAGVEDRGELLLVERQRRRRRDLDGLEQRDEIRADPLARDAEVEESFQPFLLLVLGDRRVGPRRAELRDLVNADLLQPRASDTRGGIASATIVTFNRDSPRHVRQLPEGDPSWQSHALLSRRRRSLSP